MQRRFLLLAHLVVVAVAAGKMERARSALAELDADPALRDTPALDALVMSARAEIALAEGRRIEAIADLRRAAALWREIGSPFGEGKLRVRLAGLLRADGDLETADLELAAAERAFREVGFAAGGSL